MEWKPIETAPKDGRFIDSYNANNGERRTTRYNPQGKEEPFNYYWQGWDYQWGNKPTHWLPLPSQSGE